MALISAGAVTGHNPGSYGPFVGPVLITVVSDSANSVFFGGSSTAQEFEVAIGQTVTIPLGNVPTFLWARSEGGSGVTGGFRFIGNTED